ncbi:MAG: Holliday junction resolvase RuvX [Bacilli bacterium]|nr:Holliday junction resolvase RuvX [Bacilli bacterium]
MRIIGLDLGTKTLGISMSDFTETVATTYKTINYSNLNVLLNELKSILEEHKVLEVVLGLPKNMNNTLGPAAERSLEFGKLIEDNLNIKVIYQDERLSTKQANSYMLMADMSRKKKKRKSR